MTEEEVFRIVYSQARAITGKENVISAQAEELARLQRHVKVLEEKIKKQEESDEPST